MNIRVLFKIIIAILISSCSSKTEQVKNEKKGTLKDCIRIEVTGEKKFPLDSASAPKPDFIEIFNIATKGIYLTFLNNFNNSIYIYNYNTLEFIKNISFKKTGSDAVGPFIGYHIKSMDSIYLLNQNVNKVIQTNEMGKVLNKFSLSENNTDRKKIAHYPVYFTQTSIPLIETANEIIFTGACMIGISNSLFQDLKFTSRLNLKTNKINYSFKYPASIYKSNVNWFSLAFYNMVFPELHPDGNKMVFSFPMSHDLYIGDLKTGEYTKVYAGSNYAGTINSFNKSLDNIPREDVMKHIIKQDSYTAIKYDKYRKVYYRILCKALTLGSDNPEITNKLVDIIIMDEKFNYLGETTLGKWKNWNWQNIFVTQEGLNIEYIGDDSKEDCLTFKILTLKKI